MKRIIILLLVLTPIYTLIVWPGDKVESASAATTSQSNSVTPDSEGLNSSNTSYITLDGNSITLKGSGAKVDGRKITINSAGTYKISGKLDNGRILVDTKDKETVNLVLNGVDVSCSTSAPVYIIKAEKTVITLSEGAKNYITDNNSNNPDNAKSDEPNAAVFSNDDLTITGKGSLSVNAKYNNGIQTKDDLEITGGNITVNAVNDGIKGRDSITVKGGNISVNSGGDGMQSNKIEDKEKGYVSIEGGTIKITAGGDGIQAETNLIISGGNITISSGFISDGTTGNRATANANTVRAPASIKGIKAGTDLTITGGTINIDSTDDSVHSDNSIKINGGKLLLASRNDGIGSASTIDINGGDINITKSYEGIESSVITINGGNIRLVSNDDGINGVGYTVTPTLNINGGYIAVDAYGDGIDINGYIYMKGGVVVISGPVDSMNGALDYYSFEITGGFIVAAGSSGMALPAGGTSSSTQYSLMVWFSSWQEAGTIVHIGAEDGKEILTFSPKKAYSSVTVCSPDLKKGSTYIVYSGGSSTGRAIDGLYSGGTYTPGVKITSFKISDALIYSN